MTQVNIHICKHENPIQTVICNYTETSTMKAQNVNSFLRIDERERVSLNYHESAITNTKTTPKLTSKRFKQCLQNNFVTTHDGSLLRTRRQMHTASFLRCRGVL